MQMEHLTNQSRYVYLGILQKTCNLKLALNDKYAHMVHDLTHMYYLKLALNEDNFSDHVQHVRYAICKKSLCL